MNARFAGHADRDRADRTTTAGCGRGSPDQIQDAVTIDIAAGKSPGVKIGLLPRELDRFLKRFTSGPFDEMDVTGGAANDQVNNAVAVKKSCSDSVWTA
jgi:hypothetical protein